MVFAEGGLLCGGGSCTMCTAPEGVRCVSWSLGDVASLWVMVLESVVVHESGVGGGCGVDSSVVSRSAFDVEKALRNEVLYVIGG